MASRATYLERFLSKTRKTSTGCWEWTAHRSEKGYGTLRYGGVQYRAHRLSWVLHGGGEIPPGALVCHRCDNPPCVNPAHLFLGTVADNNQDALAKGRHVTPLGSQNGGAKLDESQVAEIWRRLGTVSRRRLAREFGVSHWTINAIESGAKWGSFTSTLPPRLSLVGGVGA